LPRERDLSMEKTFVVFLIIIKNKTQFFKYEDYFYALSNELTLRLYCGEGGYESGQFKKVLDNKKYLISFYD
jgi:hypothetical protein